jgi:PEP-CTERM motif
MKLKDFCFHLQEGRMKLMSSTAVALAVGFLAFAPTSSMASVILTADLTVDHCTNGCSTGVQPFGTVTATQLAPGGVVTVDVQLAAPYLFQPHNGNSLDTFVFNPVGLGGPVLSAVSLAAGFVVGTNTNPQDGFGDFTAAIQFTLQHPTTGFLEFTMTDAGTLSVANFALSSGGSPSVFLSADISSTNGNTGPVGSGPSITVFSAVPEPSTWAMMILGFVGVGFMAYRRKSEGHFRFV